jgi:hypothetical protein
VEVVLVVECFGLENKGGLEWGKRGQKVLGQRRG